MTKLTPPLTIDTSGWKNADSIPTEEVLPYDYGKDINEKLAKLGWTADQYDMFLDWMHQEKPIDELVAALLYFATPEWIAAEAKAIRLLGEA